MTNAEWGRGAKAGLVAGGSWGIVTAIESVSLSPVGVDAPTVLILAVLRVVWGFILGLVFASVANRFMSARTYRAKGVIYGLILGIIELALNLGSFETGVTGVGINLLFGLASSLVFGYVLGYSYERFAQRDLTFIRDSSLSAREAQRYAL